MAHHTEQHWGKAQCKKNLLFLQWGGEDPLFAIVLVQIPVPSPVPISLSVNELFGSDWILLKFVPCTFLDSSQFHVTDEIIENPFKVVVFH